MNPSAEPSLVIYEEQWAKEVELVEQIKKLTTREDAEEWARGACLELLAVQVQITHPRAELGGVRDAESWDQRDDDEEETDAPNKPVPLFRGAGGSWKVPRLVGSGRLPKSGLVFEVLPKVANGQAEPERARQSLRRMWSLAADLQTRDDEEAAGVGAANDVPLHEWLVHRFLTQVKTLLARGIRMQYVEREDNLGTVRGRVLPLDNIRHNAFTPHRLYCRFDELSPDRPENRLIRSALTVLVRGCSEPVNRHRASMLAEWLHEIPPSRDVRADLARWRDDRLMKHYREIRSTCRWILLRQGISPVRGSDGMVGCFARMNDVFERYVARWIAQELPKHDDLKYLRLFDQTQAEIGNDRVRKNLWRWEEVDASWARMRPDMLVYDSREPDKCIAVLDAKWKQPKPGAMNPADIYQLHAYARYWLGGKGQVALIYPHFGDDEPAAQPFRFAELNQHELQGRKLFFKLPDGGTNDGLSKGAGARWLASLREAFGTQVAPA